VDPIGPSGWETDTLLILKSQKLGVTGPEFPSRL